MSRTIIERLMTLFGGLGMMLYAMSLIEFATEKLAWPTMTRLLERFTKNPRAWATMGTITTAIVQSSGTITLLLIAFVGAGVMQLPNAISVILGANIGTTITGVRVAAFGFGSFDIAKLSMLFIGVGGIGTLATRGKHPWKELFLFLFGFGLVFLGIDMMKDSMMFITEWLNLAQYTDYGVRTFFLIGAIVTTLVQSSTTITVLTLAALSAGAISFPASVAIVIGANLGTTSTAILASFGGQTVKRQLAFSHVTYNLLSCLLGMIFIHQFIWISNVWLGLANNPALSNAVLNLIFNVVTSIPFLIGLPLFVKVLKRLIPDKKVEAVTINEEVIVEKTIKESMKVTEEGVL